MKPISVKKLSQLIDQMTSRAFFVGPTAKSIRSLAGSIFRCALLREESERNFRQGSGDEESRQK